VVYVRLDDRYLELAEIRADDWVRGDDTSAHIVKGFKHVIVRFVVLVQMDRLEELVLHRSFHYTCRCRRKDGDDAGEGGAECASV
jgi:hypothetical protein